MRITGKTKIELTDVNTGVVETFEDKNMLTNAMGNFFNHFGVFGNYPENDSDINNTQPHEWLTGGLMLFEQPIAENVDTVYMPAGNVMVANGARGISNSGDKATNLGSFNSVESSKSVDGNRVTITYVYDFLTSQGNGTISCACLTSKAGGYMGMGNVSGRLRDFKANMESYQSGSNGNSKKPALAFNNYSYAPYNCLAYPVYDEDAMYIVNPQSVYLASSSYTAQVAVHWSKTKKIKVNKMRAGFKTIGLLDGGTLSHSKQEWDIDIPQDILTYMGTSTSYANVFSEPSSRTIYIIFCKTYDVEAGASFYVMKIDRNMNATAHRITNNTGFKLYIGDNGSSSGYRRVVFDGENMYMWAYKSSSTYQLFKIKITDSTQVFGTKANSTSYVAIFSLASGLIGIEGDFISSYDYYNAQIYDTITDEVKYTNGYGSSLRRLTPFADKSGVYIEEYMSSNDVIYKVKKEPRYLATINNLASPITKTAEKNMKITYTLTYDV